MAYVLRNVKTGDLAQEGFSTRELAEAFAEVLTPITKDNPVEIVEAEVPVNDKTASQESLDILRLILSSLSESS
jgi:fructose-bisphosphate aldolase class 1